MTDNPFLKRYKTIDNSELLDIVDAANEFQPLAVEAARLEIENRQLTPEQLADAKEKQNLRRLDHEKQQRVQNIIDKIKSTVSSVFELFNPIQTGPLKTEKHIKLITIFLIVLFLGSLYQKLDLLTFILNADSTGWDFSTLLYVLPFSLLPISALLFWLRRKPGWILAVIFSSYTAVAAVPLFLLELIRQRFETSAADSIILRTSPTNYIGSFLIYGGLTWALCRENMRAVYQIDKQTMFTVLGIGAGFILFIILMTFII